MESGRRSGLIAGSAAVLAGVLLAGAAMPAEAQTQSNDALETELDALSLEQLSEVEVTSVSGSAQPVGEAPAAIYVITSDDIERGGIRSIPGALRLAPNLQVARIDASTFGVTARGFNQSSGTANKLLVLMDGRIVYTPLFSGVFWDEQNAIMEDLDRIEVVSGPGGSLWGSNAVNGVINIVSRNAHETQGLLVTGGASDAAQALGVRYGARFGDAGAVRVYGLGLRRAVNEPAEWRNMQAGFRADWGDARDALTLQGDVYTGDQDQLPGQFSDTTISGGNILGRWTRRFSDASAFQVQAYVDRTQRHISSGIRADVDAAAIDAQYNFSLGSAHQIVLGAGARVTSDTFTPGPGTVFLDPDSRTLQTYNVFAQDTVTLSPSLELIAGLKLENNSYSGLEYMPSARLAWRPDPNALVWAAVSRAVRTPSRFDKDLINGVTFTGGPDFTSEEVVAYELGYRAQPDDRFWYSISAYYNVYDDLRTVEGTTAFVFPLQVRNGMHGETYGIEAWGSYAVTDWWRLNAGLWLLEKDLALDAGSTDVFGVGFAGNDPDVQASLRSLMDFGERTQFDLAIRYVGDLPSPSVPSYVGVDARIGYRVTDRLELSIAGYNLLDEGHVEFINPSLPPRETSRSFFISARWRS
ncbi:MAG: TonB-dependent receptor [Hyphomonadaceae bacterium]|nr:TonB-dependent receptor [Hyphomonadaceae bacterium]